MSEAVISQAAEDCLKAVYKLTREGPAATNDIARMLGVAPATVTKMLKRLAEMKLVTYQSYRGVILTEAGRKVALEVLRHHRLLELYLRDVLGYSWDQVHAEAELLEHHISEAFEAKLDEMLGHPTRDPHGHPIPRNDGTVADVPTLTMAEALEGMAVIVDHVSDEDPALLKYLEELGLMPGAGVVVADRKPFEGPITLRIADRTEIIGHRVAREIFVRPAGGSSHD